MTGETHVPAGADARAPLDLPGAGERTIAIVAMFAAGLDTVRIAALLDTGEAEVANTLAQVRARAGAAFLNGTFQVERLGCAGTPGARS